VGPRAVAQKFGNPPNPVELLTSAATLAFRMQPKRWCSLSLSLPIASVPCSTEYVQSALIISRGMHRYVSQPARQLDGAWLGLLDWVISGAWPFDSLLVDDGSAFFVLVPRHYEEPRAGSAVPYRPGREMRSSHLYYYVLFISFARQTASRRRRFPEQVLLAYYGVGRAFSHPVQSCPPHMAIASAKHIQTNSKNFCSC
jgi:hypothetical protein